MGIMNLSWHKSKWQGCAVPRSLTLTKVFLVRQNIHRRQSFPGGRNVSRFMPEVCLHHYPLFTGLLQVERGFRAAWQGDC